MIIMRAMQPMYTVQLGMRIPVKLHVLQITIHVMQCKFMFQIHILMVIWIYPCPSEEIYPSSDGCVGLDVNCNSGTKSQTQFVYNMTLHDYEWQYGSISYCCPDYKGPKLTCQGAANCVIDCTSSNCLGTFIDGTDASYLTVNCQSYECQNALIHCPIGGCSVICKGASSCSSANIVYNGELTDAGTVSVNCTDYYSCKDTMINAQYVDQIDVDCNIQKGSSNYVCYSTTLNAQYANTVNRTFREPYATYNDGYYVMIVIFDGEGKEPQALGLNGDQIACWYSKCVGVW